MMMKKIKTEKLNNLKILKLRTHKLSTIYPIERKFTAPSASDFKL